MRSSSSSFSSFLCFFLGSSECWRGGEMRCFVKNDWGWKFCLLFFLPFVLFLELLLFLWFALAWGEFEFDLNLRFPCVCVCDWGLIEVLSETTLGISSPSSVRLNFLCWVDLYLFLFRLECSCEPPFLESGNANNEVSKRLRLWDIPWDIVCGLKHVHFVEKNERLIIQMK